MKTAKTKNRSKTYALKNKGCAPQNQGYDLKNQGYTSDVRARTPYRNATYIRRIVKRNATPIRTRHNASAPSHLKQSKLKTVFSWVFAIAAALALAFFTRVYIAEPFEIPSASMLQTLKIGDRLIGEKVSYRFGNPQRGDIATFEDPEKASTTLIKRVIGVPGDTIDIRDGAVYLNGERQDESYTNGQDTYPLNESASFLDAPISYPYTLKAGEYWMMGDNRNNSLDSRYFGPIAREAMTSKAWFIFWPFTEAKVL